MPVYAIAASAGPRGKVGKLCPAGHGESVQSTGTGNWILRFPILLSDAECGRPRPQQRAKPEAKEKGTFDFLDHVLTTREMNPCFPE
jgi:hypothetical protein